MDKTEARAVINYLQKKRMALKEIPEDMVQIFAEDSSYDATVKKWSVEFKEDKDAQMIFGRVFQKPQPLMNKLITSTVWF